MTQHINSKKVVPDEELKEKNVYIYTNRSPFASYHNFLVNPLASLGENFSFPTGYRNIIN